jgi:dipeptidyl aminopeptidase/acylaminoacyl peptidase
MKKAMRPSALSLCLFAILALAAAPAVLAAGTPVSPEDILGCKRAGAAAISPSGEWIAYTVSVPRTPAEAAGRAYSELWVVSSKTGDVRPFVTGRANVSQPRWSPDGTRIAFLMARGEKAKTQVWMIPFGGGEARPVTASETSVSTFRWHPAGDRIAYVAATPDTKREEELDAKGYGFTFFEENLKDRNLYLLDVGAEGGVGDRRILTENCSVWEFEWSPDGAMIAAAISPRNLVDERYMFKKIWIIDVESKERRRLSDNPGKLGHFAWSPDGARIAFNAAKELRDHAESQVYVIDIASGETRNLTETDFRGHVEWVGWKDKNTVLYRSGEGVYPTLSLVGAAGGVRKIILDAKSAGVIFDAPSFTMDFKRFAFTGSTSRNPSDVYVWDGKAKEPRRLTHINPSFAGREFGSQEVIRWKARDGVEIEGILIRPVGYEAGTKYPLIVIVHGGPESHYSNGWVSSYGTPAQAFAGKGYAVLLPNYRASTGYGLDFALAGYNDAAGVEFDDIADGIDHLVAAGLADPARVGLTGGSYGGYAAAWFASRYTEKVKAVCMFVGISDLTSKRLTTDIPYEELYVHSGKPIEEMWRQSLERSPIYWAHQSATAVLIVGGAADPRVHPSQSIEFFRILKMNDHPAVRFVQYPGEGHGNAGQPGRADVLFRQLDWFDWYVRDGKPIEGPMPPLDISDRYGLELEAK